MRLYHILVRQMPFTLTDSLELFNEGRVRGPKKATSATVSSRRYTLPFLSGVMNQSFSTSSF